MPERSHPEPSHSTPRTARVATHLGVVALLILTSVAAFASQPFGSSEATSASSQSFRFVSSVRGAVHSEPSLRSVHFEIAADPRSRDAMLERRVLPTPIPTPRATPVEPPPATPEPKPSRVAVAPAPPASSHSLGWPVRGGVITQYFSSHHTALDIAVPAGSPVHASAAGVVVSAGWRTTGGGYVIQIDHGNGIQTLYNHLGKIQVSVGQAVARGQQIALVGCTGICTGPHVHFEVRVHGVDVNPLRYL